MDQFIVRLPDGMRDRIKAAAEANNRSMNAEVVAALEEKYPAPKLDVDRLVELMMLITSTRDQSRRVTLVAELNRIFAENDPSGPRVGISGDSRLFIDDSESE